MTICPIIDGTVSIISFLYRIKGKIRKFLGRVFHDLASQREVKFIKEKLRLIHQKVKKIKSQ